MTVVDLSDGWNTWVLSPGSWGACFTSLKPVGTAPKSCDIIWVAEHPNKWPTKWPPFYGFHTRDTEKLWVRKLLVFLLWAICSSYIFFYFASILRYSLRLCHISRLRANKKNLAWTIFSSDSLDHFVSAKWTRNLCVGAKKRRFCVCTLHTATNYVIKVPRGLAKLFASSTIAPTNISRHSVVAAYR